MHHYTWKSFGQLRYAAIAENVEQARQLILTQDQNNIQHEQIIINHHDVAKPYTDDYIKHRTESLQKIVEDNEPEAFEVPSDTSLYTWTIDKVQYTCFADYYDEAKAIMTAKTGFHEQEFSENWCRIYKTDVPIAIEFLFMPEQ